MLGFGAWGDPYVDRNDMGKLEVGDTVRVKLSNVVRPGNTGILTLIDDKYGDYQITFPDGLTCVYDGDMIVLVNKKEEEQNHV